MIYAKAAKQRGNPIRFMIDRQSIATLAVVPGVALSDHQSFWRHGYKALMVTDTAMYRYPYYHTNQDTPDKFVYAPFTKAANGLFLMLCRLANASC